MQTLVQEQVWGVWGLERRSVLTEPNKQDESGGREDRVRPCRQGSDYMHGKQPKFYSVMCLDTINKI